MADVVKEKSAVFVFDLCHHLLFIFCLNYTAVIPYHNIIILMVVIRNTVCCITLTTCFLWEYF